MRMAPRHIVLGIKHKMIAWITLVFICPLILLNIVIRQVIMPMTLDSALTVYANRVENIADSFLDYVQSQIDTTLSYATNGAMQNLLAKTSRTAPPERQQSTLFLYTLLREFTSINANRRYLSPYHYALITDYGESYTNYLSMPRSELLPIAQALAAMPWWTEMNALRSRSVQVFLAEHMLLEGGARQLYVATNIIDDQYQNRGVVLLGVDAEYVRNLLVKPLQNLPAQARVVDERGITLFANGADAGPSALPEELALKHVGGVALGPVGESYVFERSIALREAGCRWRLLISIPERNVTGGLTVLHRLIAYLIGFGLICLLMCVIALNKIVTQPILALSASMDRVAKGELGATVSVTSNDEIGKLQRHFNHMLGRINRQIDIIAAEQEEKRTIEVRLLQSQIRPHFVRNTLNTIRWMAQMRGMGGVEKSILSFSDLLDYCFQNANRVVELQQEIAYLREYCYLQLLRYQNRFDVCFSVDDDVQRALIPKLLIQPVLENSILHGVLPKHGVGTIGISARAQNGALVIVVTDDGVGMDKGRLAHIWDDAEENEPRESGIALVNVRKRIQREYGQAYGVEIQSKLGEGTRVTLTIPLLPSTGGEENEHQNERADR